jgi:SAM-dependent methyltransferase
VDLREEVRSDSFNVLGEVEVEVFRRIGLSGKRVAHLCCNNGRELISILKMGAAHGTGFDISDEAIREARLLAELAQIRCDFVRTNLLDIGYEYDATFDVVFFSVGALTWFHELNPLFDIVARILAPHGWLVVYEMHPFTDMLALKTDEGYDANDEMKIVFSYFRGEPWVDEDGLDYVGGTTYASKPSYSFPHTLGETISAIAGHGLVIYEMREFPHDLSNGFQGVEKQQKLPLSYLLLARKGAV